MKWTAEMKAAQSKRLKAKWVKNKVAALGEVVGTLPSDDRYLVLHPKNPLLPTIQDLVNHPPHYTSHPSGVECIQVTEHLNFCVGNAIKYLWRAGEKGSYVQDLEKAKWYIEREIARMRTS